MRRRWLVALGAAVLAAMGVLSACRTDAADSGIRYEHEMVRLVADMSVYARAVNPDFGLIANGGSSLFAPSDYNTEEDAARMCSAVVGAMAESMFYGNNMTDNERTPNSELRFFIENLTPLQDAGGVVLSLDYASDKKCAADAYKKAASLDYLEQVSAVRDLDEMPVAPINNENDAAVTSLKQAKNYLTLLNPGHFPSRSAYLDALAASNYDLLIIDAYYDDAVLSPVDVARLQRKPNGARRLVYAYLSIGEAGDYRTYWQPVWNKKRPTWMADANEDWEGDYKVKYWDREWKSILYGSKDSELDKILSAGFDGAFLDVVDAFDYFRSREE